LCGIKLVGSLRMGVGDVDRGKDVEVVRKYKEGRGTY
jgi:hypothetical protein